MEKQSKVVDLFSKERGEFGTRDLSAEFSEIKESYGLLNEGLAYETGRAKSAESDLDTKLEDLKRSTDLQREILFSVCDSETETEKRIRKLKVRAGLAIGLGALGVILGLLGMLLQLLG